MAYNNKHIRLAHLIRATFQHQPVTDAGFGSQAQSMTIVVNLGLVLVTRRWSARASTVSLLHVVEFTL